MATIYDNQHASNPVAYTTSESITGLSAELSTAISSTWLSWIASEIDSMLNLNFHVRDETYYIRMGELTNKLILKTPLHSVNIDDSDYSAFVNVESKENIFPTPDQDNASILNYLSPVVYIKEHDSTFPPLTSTTALIEGKDYYVSKTAINKLTGTWKQFVEIRYCWGFSDIPNDVQMLASLMGAEFALSQQSSTESASERIGDYQYTSFKDASSGGWSDNVANLRSSILSKYSLVSIASNTSTLLNRGILRDCSTPSLTVSASLPSSRII